MPWAPLGLKQEHKWPRPAPPQRPWRGGDSTPKGLGLRLQGWVQAGVGVGLWALLPREARGSRLGPCSADCGLRPEGGLCGDLARPHPWGTITWSGKRGIAQSEILSASLRPSTWARRRRGALGFPGGICPQNMRARETKARVPIRNLTPSAVPRSVGQTVRKDGPGTQSPAAAE